MKIEISSSTGIRSELKALAKAVEPELVADTLPSTLALHLWGRARSMFRMRHIRAAIEKAQFLTKAHSLVNADDGDGKGIVAAFTERERVQLISLLSQVCAKQKLNGRT